MMWGLPSSIEIAGESYEIRTDFRVILDIFEMLEDPNFDGTDRAQGILDMFYVAGDTIPQKHRQEAVDRFTWFQNGGEILDKKNMPKLVDWAQDYSMIIGAVNKSFQSDLRSVSYDEKANSGGVHWWTFLAAYNNIGDCTFSHVVQLRDKKARGKALTKEEREWYRRNREIVDIKRKYSDAENEVIGRWV